MEQCSRGPCKIGVTDGVGVFKWKNADGTAMRLHKHILRGETKLKLGETLTYVGSLLNDVSNDEGYLKCADVLLYEGDSQR